METCVLINLKDSVCLNIENSRPLDILGKKKYAKNQWYGICQYYTAFCLPISSYACFNIQDMWKTKPINDDTEFNSTFYIIMFWDKNQQHVGYHAKFYSLLKSIFLI